MTTPWQVREDGRGWVAAPVKVVGIPRRFSPREALAWNAAMLRLSPLCGNWFPQGVFKFRSWEDERRWTIDQINQAQPRQRTPNTERLPASTKPANLNV